MINVSIVPLWHQHRENRIFKPKKENATFEAFSRWREVAISEGFELNTDDILPPRDADAIWFIDLPRTRKLFNEAISPPRDSSKKLILQALESPILSRSTHQTANYTPFDYILTYNKKQCLTPSHFHYRIPNYLKPESNRHSFSDRKCMVMINSNRMEGWLAASKVGTRKFAGLRKVFNGWKLSLREIIVPDQQELYSWRRKFAREADRHFPSKLDVYGHGWNGEPIIWPPWPRPKPYRCANHDLLEDPQRMKVFAQKIPATSRYRFGVAVENYRGSKEYISEKIFDVVRSGSVPVYLGEESISTLVPSEAFVDVRNFSTHRALLQYLTQCPEPEWRKMLDAGQTFLCSPPASQFGIPQFVDAAMSVLRQL